MEPSCTKGSVSRWIREMEDGDEAALEQLSNRYYEQLVQYARTRLSPRYRRVTDEEDVANSVFDSLWRGVQRGKFPGLHDRDNLWRLLMSLAARKAIDRVRHEERQKRGGGEVQGESGIRGSDSDSNHLGLDQLLGNQPTPEFEVMMAEECGRLMESLGDPVLQRIAALKLEGFRNDEIAEQLELALRTVERKLRMVRTKWSERGKPDGRV